MLVDVRTTHYLLPQLSTHSHVPPSKVKELALVCWSNRTLLYDELADKRRGRVGETLSNASGLQLQASPLSVHSRHDELTQTDSPQLPERVGPQI